MLSPKFGSVTPCFVQVHIYYHFFFFFLVFITLIYHDLFFHKKTYKIQKTYPPPSFQVELFSSLSPTPPPEPEDLIVLVEVQKGPNPKKAKMVEVGKRVEEVLRVGFGLDCVQVFFLFCFVFFSSLDFDFFFSIFFF